MQIAVECFIEAPPDAAFSTAIDISNWPRFISGVQSVELLTPGPVAAGTRFRETRSMFGRKASEDMTLTQVERPRRFLLTAFNHGTAYRAEHLFAPEAAGTRTKLIFEGQPATLLARLFAPLGWLFVVTLKRQLESDLADLKLEAEQRHRQREA
jgi:carbon monoxide dehydrogenase subunit G